MLTCPYLREPEVDSLVSRTFARAQTPSRRAWLTAARRAVPGDHPTPSPRPVLTATPDFVSRHRSARRGRAPLRALFCPVRGLPPEPRPWPSVRRPDTPYPTPPTTPRVPLIANTRSSAWHAPPSSDLDPPCVSRRRGASREQAMITRNYINFRNFYDFCRNFSESSPNLP